MKGGARRNKPAALRVIEGSRVRPRHKFEPRVLPQVPEPPEHLNERELALWHYYAKLLGDAKMLTLQDRDCLSQYCEARARIAELAQWSSRDPRVDAQRRAWITVARMCGSELGLSPVSRGRVQVRHEQESGDGFDAYMAQLKAVK